MTGAYRYWTTPDCVRHWAWFPKVGPAEIVRATVPACIKAGVLALPLVLPGAAFVPAVAPVAYPQPIYSGPAYEVGAGLFVPGVYSVPALAANAVQAGLTHPYAGSYGQPGGNAAVGESPTPYVTTYAAPHDVPVWVPGEGGPTSVPEPNSALIVLAGVGVLALLVRVSE